ncbi:MULTISPECIES: hypothetical protein [Burkholderia]|uniref:Uncharacterized protein n=1 Tax=Burkholderia diffusa TaxID=488732 RepID=A0A6P2IDT9_9BURK|nr:MULTISPECIES: hypothetical protein [Burkholderia]MBM2653264.1 hypothetical protein [Burkholderia diffusa]MCA8201251.1 hypothetical protein [Burkholderia sp. AU33545]MDN7902678.1 hypothetical protein [Burkholderia diffusa]VWB27623.1 hypothetical protein BDI24065_01158 [Burkholderia diffusa]
MSKERVPLASLIVRYRTPLNVAVLIACGLWAAWIAWMTRPSAIDSPSSIAAYCVRDTR